MSKNKNQKQTSDNNVTVDTTQDTTVINQPLFTLTDLISAIAKASGLSNPVKNNGVCLSKDANVFTMQGLSGAPKAITHIFITSLYPKQDSGLTVQDFVPKAGQVLIMAKADQLAAIKSALDCDNVPVAGYFKHSAFIAPIDKAIAYVNK